MIGPGVFLVKSPGYIRTLQLCLRTDLDAFRRHQYSSLPKENVKIWIGPYKSHEYNSSLGLDFAYKSKDFNHSSELYKKGAII
ncbi:hypothetical protein EYC80_007173 [Monilinia laxa]|uniref:Uncharacterized protein n=1 Tax=Monilinia laxa TaxID=61186 RepID=A0A5N6K0H0_MONLA|nr:hypothetical protein EYC80_007173 [Monilinia laxa]